MEEHGKWFIKGSSLLLVLISLLVALTLIGPVLTGQMTAFAPMSQTKDALTEPDAEPMVFESLEFRNVCFRTWGFT